MGKGRFLAGSTAGLLSATNLDALDTAGLRFTVGSRVVKAPAA